MIELFGSKQDCCGCTACVSICPESAITMESDAEGFLYPKIDVSKCSECGLCKKVCAFQNGYDSSGNILPPRVLAVKHADETTRTSSTSGGAFSAIAEYFLKNEGIVYGVALDSDLRVVHQRADTLEGVEAFKGSKYVQSNLDGIFESVKKDLSDGRFVLFSGTPCQIAGLNEYLMKADKSKLFLCDVVCCGVPSPLLWEDHLRLLEKKNKSVIEKYFFRSKVKGWTSPTVQITFKNGKKDYRTALSQSHRALFSSLNAMRPACYNCKYRNFERPADISIADFWGIEDHMPDFIDELGVSLVLINTPKGETIFDNISENLIYREGTTDMCSHASLRTPLRKPPQRDAFWIAYQKYGYEYIVKKYGDCAFFGLKRVVKKFVGRTLRKLKIDKIVKKLLGRV